jgi:hypothetical protein
MSVSLCVWHYEEIASFFGINVRTLRRRKQNPTFAAALRKGRNKGKISLRLLQFEKFRATPRC